MGFWHTGYAEFHEPIGLGEYSYTPAPPARYVCEQCGQDFADIEALRRHRFEQHPLRQPSLLVRGRPVGSIPLKVMSLLTPSEIIIEDATRCRVNGHELSMTMLQSHLSLLTQNFVDVELINDSVTSKFMLDFRVAENDDLEGVEAGFLRLARDQTLTTAAISRFIKDCEDFPTAKDYCDGICQYLYGVMAKEHSPDSGLQPGRYVGKFSQSVDTLSGFDRVLARTICALIAFNFNHFSDAATLAPASTLRDVATAFAGLLQGQSWQNETASATGGQLEQLLTDQDTLQILTDASDSLLKLKTRTEELQAHLRRATAGYDRLKRALLTAEALAAIDSEPTHKQARRIAREWVGNSDTSIWAQGLLNRLGKR